MGEFKRAAGIWPCGPGMVAGDEGDVVLGALEAVTLGSPEGGKGWAVSPHMQHLLLDSRGQYAGCEIVPKQ